MEKPLEQSPNSLRRSGYSAVDPSRRWLLFGAQVPLLAAVIFAIDPLLIAGEYARALIIVVGSILSVIMFIRLAYGEAIQKKGLERELQQTRPLEQHGTVIANE